VLFAWDFRVYFLLRKRRGEVRKKRFGFCQKNSTELPVCARTRAAPISFFVPTVRRIILLIFF
jgi:hypothetical protein